MKIKQIKENNVLIIFLLWLITDQLNQGSNFARSYGIVHVPSILLLTISIVDIPFLAQWWLIGKFLMSKPMLLNHLVTREYHHYPSLLLLSSFPLMPWLLYVYFFEVPWFSSWWDSPFGVMLLSSCGTWSILQLSSMTSSWLVDTLFVSMYRWEI